jgi:membrane fusion protein, multidrug efflux system
MLKHDDIHQSEQTRAPVVARANEPLKTQQTPEKRLSPGTKFVLASVCILIIVGIVWAIGHHMAAAKAAAAAAHSGPPAVPVVAGKVEQKDVPIYLDGLGTVQAFNTVTVKVQVDGQLMKVAFTEGQEVHAGDLLAQIDPSPFQAQVEQAEAKKAQDEAQLANARLDLNRDAEQLAAKIVAQQVYDTQKTVVDQLTAQVKVDQAAIDFARVQLDYTTVKSPVDGRTGIRQVDQGNIVHATDTNGLVVVAQLHPISVLFTLPEQNLTEIQNYSNSVDFTVLAVGRDNSTLLGKGKLSVIDNRIDPSTGTIRIKATFANEDLRLWPGQFVNARLLLTTRKGGLVVPASVVQRGPDGPYAFVIKDDQSVEVRPVKVAQIEAGQALIDSGLRVGESVVVDGQYRLQTGSHVKPATSAKPGNSE